LIVHREGCSTRINKLAFECIGHAPEATFVQAGGRAV
jgi:hypothetical protein